MTTDHGSDEAPPSTSESPTGGRRSVAAAWAAVFLLSITLSLAGCGQRATPAVSETTSTNPVVSLASSGPVSVQLSAMPPTVRLDRDILLTIQTQTPSNIQVKLPPIEDRLTGFTVAGSFDQPPVARNGNLVRERHVRLTPKASPRYRIAPMAIVWHDRTGHEQWFPTRPLVLSSESLVKGDPGTSLAGARSPVHVYPGLGSVLRYTAIALALAALGVLVWWAARRIHREVQLRRMSPRERALHELADLLARDLVGKDRVKDFYFELTMIVRAYIERAHAIRAPEQTTEEFLEAASRDPRFSPAVVTRLRAFMQAADLVKYAAYRPDQPAIDQSLTTATTYIETDADAINLQPPTTNP